MLYVGVHHKGFDGENLTLKSGTKLGSLSRPFHRSKKTYIGHTENSSITETETPPHAIVVMPKHSVMFNKQHMYFQRCFEEKQENPSRKFWPVAVQQLASEKGIQHQTNTSNIMQTDLSLRELNRRKSACKKHTYEGRVAYLQGDILHYRLEFIELKYHWYLIVRIYRCLLLTQGRDLRILRPTHH